MYNKNVEEWKHKKYVRLYESPILTEHDKATMLGKGNIMEETEGEGFDLQNVSKPRTPFEKMSPADKAFSIARRKSYYAKKIHYMTDLAIHNSLNSFITLTFAENITDQKVMQHEWDLFLKRLKYDLNKTYGNFELKYIATFERQKRGALHIHFVSNTGYFDHKRLEKLWRHGYVYIEKVTNETQIQYMMKYIQKSLAEEAVTNVQNRARKIYVSRNMTHPKVYQSVSDETMEDIVFANMESVENTYSYDVKDSTGTPTNTCDVIIIKK